jgi:predicted O-linked N-acetylglucosamine transferase (SPINDLY family)
LAGAGILRSAGRAEWIAHDEKEFAIKAAAVAGDVVHGRLSREALRRQIAESPLCDVGAFARAFEDACAAMLEGGAKP